MSIRQGRPHCWPIHQSSVRDSFLYLSTPLWIGLLDYLKYVSRAPYEAMCRNLSCIGKSFAVLWGFTSHIRKKLSLRYYIKSLTIGSDQLWMFMVCCMDSKNMGSWPSGKAIENTFLITNKNIECSTNSACLSWSIRRTSPLKQSFFLYISTILLCIRPPNAFHVKII